MVRMDLLELLRKRGMDGDVDFLREALRVLVDGIRTPRFPPRSALSTANAARSGSPTATATGPWDTRVGTMALQLREGSYFPSAGTTAAQ